MTCNSIIVVVVRVGFDCAHYNASSNSTMFKGGGTGGGKGLGGFHPIFDLRTQMLRADNQLLCSLSRQPPPSRISVPPPLTMLSFAGKHGHDENLLHFCMRHKLDGMATLLLQPNNIEGKVYYLQQRGYDNKTPIEIARKNDMKRITEIAQGILVGAYKLV